MENKHMRNVFESMSRAELEFVLGCLIEFVSVNVPRGTELVNELINTAHELYIEETK